jgi:hypothetical protein
VGISTSYVLCSSSFVQASLRIDVLVDNSRLSNKYFATIRSYLDTVLTFVIFLSMHPHQQNWH